MIAYRSGLNMVAVRSGCESAWMSKTEILKIVRPKWTRSPWLRDHGVACWECLEAISHGKWQHGCEGFCVRAREPAEGKPIFPHDALPEQPERALLDVAPADDATPAPITPRARSSSATLAFRTRPVVEVHLNGTPLPDDALAAIGILVQVAMSAGMAPHDVALLVERYIDAVRRHEDPDAEMPSLPGFETGLEPDVLIVP